MKIVLATVLCVLTLGYPLAEIAMGRDLKDLQKDGVLRHLGVPYANFVNGPDVGLDVEMMKLFATEIGVRYEYVPTTWKGVVGDLIGNKVIVDGKNVKMGDKVPIRGDIIANGMTILASRQVFLNFSAPTFPTQVWLVAGSRSSLHPITPNGDLQKDIVLVKGLLANKTVFGISGTCLDPKLYDLDAVHAVSKLFEGSLNELAPAVIQGEAETTLLDVPDSLIALEKWPGQVKVLGPISEQQEMAVAFRKDSPELEGAFAKFFNKIQVDGTYVMLVKKYYPDVFYYYPEFFIFKNLATAK